MYRGQPRRRRNGGKPTRRAARRGKQPASSQVTEPAWKEAAVVRALYDAVDVAVVGCDLAGRVTMCNRRARELYAADDRLGEPVESWASAVRTFEADGVTPMAEPLPLTRVLRDGDPCEIEFRVVRAGTPHQVRAYAYPLRGADGSLLGAVAVLHDAGEPRQDASQLRAQCRELMQANADLAQSVTELAAFAGMISHDLKSPLATVAGYLQLLDHLGPDGRSSAQYDEFLAGMAESIQGMRALVDDLLEFATAPGARLQPSRLDLDALVRDVTAAYVDVGRLGGTGGAARPNVVVEPLPPVFADRVLLRRVIDNLVGNAIKFVQPGHAARVRISARNDAPGWVRVEVADRGIGVPDGLHDQIFSGLRRVHSAYGYPGTGLGLALCKRIVHRHGGLIGARPNSGGGTLIWLTLPASEEAAVPLLREARTTCCRDEARPVPAGAPACAP